LFALQQALQQAGGIQQRQLAAILGAPKPAQASSSNLFGQALGNLGRDALGGFALGGGAGGAGAGGGLPGSPFAPGPQNQFTPFAPSGTTPLGFNPALG